MELLTADDVNGTVDFCFVLIHKPQHIEFMQMSVYKYSGFESKKSRLFETTEVVPINQMVASHLILWFTLNE